MHVKKKWMYKHRYIRTLHTCKHTDIHKNGTRYSHTEQPLSDQGNDKNYAHHTHTHHTPLHSLSYSLLFFFWGGGGGGGAPLLCVRTFSCKCMCVCVCMWTVTTTTKGKAFRPAATATTMSTGASFCLFERRATTTKKNLNRNFNVAAGVDNDGVFQYGFFFAALVSSCQFHQWFLKIRN